MSALTVITLTCNRKAKLLACWERLEAQLADDDRWLVIDTGSTDGSPQALEALSDTRILLLPFTEKGSWAEMRNFGIRHAQSELIAFLDDDCYASEDWVARGKAGLARYDALGGMVRPHGITRFPRWWHPEMGWLVGLSSPGHAGPDAGRIHYPSTSNLWVRRNVAERMPFQEIGGQLGGPERERYATGREDAQWWRSLRTGGAYCGFDPEMAVEHAFDPQRLNKEYCLRRAELDGQAWALREGVKEDIPHLAYQCWWQGAMAWGGCWLRAVDSGSRLLHKMLWRRQRAALEGLLQRYGGATGSGPVGKWRILAQAGGRFTKDRAKTLLRTAAYPWLRSSPRRPLPQHPRRVAIAGFAFLGDMVVFQAALRGAMAVHPEVEWHLLLPPPLAALFKGIKGIEISVTPQLEPANKEAKRWVTDWFAKLAPDVILAPYLHPPWGQTLLAMRRPPCPIVSFDQDNGLLHERERLRVSLAVAKDMTLPEVQNHARLLTAVGLKAEPLPSHVYPGLDARRDVQAMMEQLGWQAESSVPLVMLNPYAGDAQKHWEIEHWCAVIKYLMKQTDARVLINAFETHDAWAEACEVFPQRIHALGRGSLENLLAWVSVCDLLVTVDGGPQHLAHAMEIPSVTLYGASDERRWGDAWQRPIHRTLRACMHNLAPDERRGLAYNHATSLISPEAVIEAIRSMGLLRHRDEAPTQTAAPEAWI